MIQLKFDSGKTYILAISGGVDSMALLHMCAQVADAEFIVAHANHGIRDDSGQDEALVRDMAKHYGLRFESSMLHLSAGASEDEARQARYMLLFDLKKRYGADAVVTAHHTDDALETSIYNSLRSGSASPGLNMPGVMRPLIGFRKSELIEYAREHGLHWREDSTNTDVRYARNLIRKRLVPMMEQMAPGVMQRYRKALASDKTSNKRLAK